QQCAQLAQRCAELIDKLRARLGKAEDMKLAEAVNELRDLLLKIGSFVIERANLGNIESLVRQTQTAAELNTFNHTIDAYATRFRIISATGLKRQWHRVDKCYRQDQKEVKKMLLEFVRNDGDIELAIKEQSGVLALMTTIQEVIYKSVHHYVHILFTSIQMLRKQRPGTEAQTTLREGSNTLYGKTNILPPLTDLTGQVIKRGGYCTTYGKTQEHIYEGQWVGTDRVMVKAIKDMESEYTIKLLRQEVVTWRQLNHPNVLEFYGICYSEPTPFAITGSENNGNILRYLERQPEHDRVEFLTQVALGLSYIHTFEPTVVHGDLRAWLYLGERAGFSFWASTDHRVRNYSNQIIALEEGAEIVSARLRDAGALRWMAPELLDYYGSSSCAISTSSDVWSFGMLCLELFTERPPYWGYTDEEVARHLTRHSVLPVQPTQSSMCGRRLSGGLWSLMQRCWAWHCRSRPQMCTIAEDIDALCEGIDDEVVKEHKYADKVFGLGDTKVTFENWGASQEGQPKLWLYA
ncbi:hypothetical protein FRC12_002146, partial [Ceratobasidium sp. 428]